LSALAIGQRAPGARTRGWLPRGVAGAAALSLAVHAAVLVGYRAGGGGAPVARPPVPMITTRLVLAREASVGPGEAAPATPTPAAPDRPSEPGAPAPGVPPAPAESSTAPPPPLPAAPSPPAAPPVEVVAAPVAASPGYLAAEGLDVAPYPLGDIDPAIPEDAGDRGGTVVLRLLISEKGEVDRAEVLRSTPPGLFDASAIAAATRVRFSPGYIGGVAVASQVTRVVIYRGKGSGKDAAGRTY
jgi:TonB family protein